MNPQNLKALPHRKHFASKVLRNALAASIVLCISLLIGIFGYMYFFNLSFVDAFYNASMILTGMGPADKALNNGAKIFAAFYAIYSGVAFLTCVAILFAPIAHRFLHKFHLDVEE